MGRHVIHYPDAFGYDNVPLYSEEWLWREYWDNGLSVADIADKYSVTQYHVENLFIEHDVPKRKAAGAFLRWKSTNRIVALMTSGSLSRNRTSIERALYGELDKLGIEYTPQYSPQGYPKIYDAFIQPNILVEVHGDYWHSRLGVRLNDEHKEAWAYDNGHILVVIWEHEIKELGIEPLVADRILAQVGGKGDD